MIVNNKLEKMWKEAVAAKFELISCHIPGEGADENQESPQ
jgi:hypothetical protein